MGTGGTAAEADPVAPAAGAVAPATKPRRPSRAPTGLGGHARIGALDGLRGVAVIGVVLFHGGHLRGGFLGVDLFFVLSGFLITTVLLRSVEPGGGIGLRTFWARRARRLLPALLVVLVVVLPVYAHWFAKPVDLPPVRQDGVASLFYVTNWSQILHGQSYFAATLADSPLRHMWSLAVEEQFYLLWPLVVLAAVRRGGTKAVFKVAAVLGLASAALTIVLGATKVVSLNSIYLGTHTRAAALLAGAALAAWFTLHGPPRAVAKARLEVGAVVAVVVLAVMWVSLSITSTALYVGGLAVSAVAAATLVAYAATATTGPLAKVLAVKPLRYLGTISYGVYLWSWPITQLVSERHTPLRGWTLLAVQVIITVDLAAASWLLLEQPILKGSIRAPRSKWVLGIAAITTAMVVVLSTAGAIEAPSTKVSTAGYSMSKKRGAPRMLVIGDSLPNRIDEEGIVPQRNLLGVSTVDRTVPGCILLRSIGVVKGFEGDIRDDVRPCDNDWGKLVERFDPEVVLLMFGEFPNDAVKIDGEFNLPCTPDYQREEEKALGAAFDELTAKGARVVLSTAPGTSVSWVLAGVPKGMNDRVACMNRLYERVAAEHERVSTVDLASYICPEPGRCKDSIDGLDLRQDTVHFRGESAQLVARWLVPKVLGTKPVQVAPATTGTTAPTGPKPPFCSRAASMKSTITEFSSSKDQSPAERAALLRAMRTALPPDLAASAPADLRADAAAVAAEWGPLLDRAAALSSDPSGSELTAALGDLAGPITHLLTWTSAHCG